VTTARSIIEGACRTSPILEGLSRRHPKIGLGLVRLCKVPGEISAVDLVASVEAAYRLSGQGLGEPLETLVRRLADILGLRALGSGFASAPHVRAVLDPWMSEDRLAFLREFDPEDPVTRMIEIAKGRCSHGA
jgi:hypothetical protein